MIRKVWQWLQLWGLMYYAYGGEIVLKAFATVILATVTIGGLMYVMPELLARNNA